MPSFALAQGAYRYRPLKLAKPQQRGFDVFALQTALVGIDYDLPRHGADGYLGRETEQVICAAQAEFALKVDGVAGVLTQRALVLELIKNEEGLPDGLLYGQVEHESSFWLGNHTAPYDDGARDCGVCQRNTNFTPQTEGFNVPLSLEALAHRLRTKRAEYLTLGNGVRRSWELAAGAWNAPSWCDRLAKGMSLTASQKAHIDAYIADATAYVTRWGT